jgi:hypothetical protein
MPALEVAQALRETLTGLRLHQLSWRIMPFAAGPAVACAAAMVRILAA